MRTSLLIVFMVMAFFFSLSASRDTITPTQPLADGEVLVSAGGTFALGFFTPANTTNRYVGMWFNNVADRRIVWVANRASPVVNSTGLLSITTNGMMVITDQKLKKRAWSVGTAATGLTAPAAQLLETGNFVLEQNGDDSTRSYAWQSFDYPTDTLLAGMKLGLDWITGFSTNLTSWENDIDPSGGAYYVAVDPNTDTYLYTSSGVVVWRSGPWDAINFRSKGLNYKYVNSSQESTFSFQEGDRPMLFVTSATGKAQLFGLSSDAGGQWELAWEEPSTQCNYFGQCGPNGICDASASPMCGCLEGYVPKSPSRWASENWTDGCVRKTGLDCRNGTDGFVVVHQAKMPESAIPTPTPSLAECRLACLRDCSCVAYANDGGRYGCAIWLNDSLWDVVRLDGFDQDLYVRVASSYLDSRVQPHRKKHKKVAILVSLLLGALVLTTACVACVLKKRKTRLRGKIDTKRITKLSTGKSNESTTVDTDIPSFDFATIETATDYFSAANELGQGGFGTVYKGKLSDDQVIAVKRLAATSLQGTDEFKNEVNLIAKLQNVNLVRLLGCCIEGTKERMLIYEYMPNRSLDAFLFDKEKGALLDWGTRYQIIIGIARGLLYLHHDSLFRIIHRDLKASNILLDNCMNPKISDFGMARLFGGDETDFNTRKIVGTYGYMSPEYAMEGIFSLKSDVFSFGVVILEIISGKKNRGENAPSPYLNLVGEAWSLWTTGQCYTLVDESMSKNLSENEVLRCIKIGLFCVQEHPEDRPLMSSVIVMLGADVASLPEPKLPGFAARVGQLDLDKVSKKHDSSTSNELTITLDGR
ncbi:receptor-like serine/threonine-protein kinase SD1-8 [Iris pallida]|uniref:Receptor-like serine/threonine-protein kinase n=1 Tax=Iris pallida TaxID=29817 RepID=A0AAX6DXY2_IRIPA|nr:receptor-like serine/threonine-protein kinase SD1-8 [Iris pallida]